MFVKNELMFLRRTVVLRRRIIYKGRVQGVGFRFSAVRIAAGLNVAGFVRNLPDRSVEVEIEGEKKEIQAFMDELAETMSGNIRDVSYQDMPVGGSYHRFEIRY